MLFRSFRTPRRVRYLVCAVALAATSASVSAQVPGSVVSARPAQPDRAFDDARSLYDGGLFGPAERAFADFLDRYPRDARAPEALYLRGESALAAGDDVIAAGLFGRFQALYPDHPLAPRARLALGRYYYAQGDDVRAEDALAAALARPGSPESRAEAAYLLGLVHRRQGRSQAAASAFEQAADGDTPTAPPALYALGTLYADAQNWSGAADAFGRLQDRYPDSQPDRDAGLAYAEALVRTGRLADGAAQADRRRPTLTGEDAARAALLSGESRLRLGDADGARDVLDAVPADSRYARRAALAQGRAASAQSDWADAVGYYAAASGDDAVGHEAAYYSALALKELGRLGDAETQLVRATQRPDGVYTDAALLELGLLNYERRRYADAVTAFRSVLSRSPRGPYSGEAARMMGEAYAANGDAAQARDAFRLAEELGTATAGTRAEVSFQDAYALFLADRFAEATPALLAVAAADPDGPRAGEALFWAGESAFRTGEFARAEALQQDFLARFPGHPRSDAALYVIAWSRYQRGDVQGAADAFERFLSAYTPTGELVPYYADALLRLGDLYTTLGRYNEARQVYALVAPATPGRQGGDYALFQTAAAYGREGRTDDAVATYSRLLREYPTSERYAQALIAQGALYSASGADSLAIQAYERVLNERPESGAAALLGIGDVLVNQGRYPLAEAAYRRVLSQYPASTLTSDAFEGLADALDGQGRGDEIDGVYAELEAATADSAARGRLRYARAQLALASGRDSVAVVALEAVLSGSPSADVEEQALLSLAGAYTSVGRFTDAARAYRRLQSRFPSGPYVAEAQLRLSETLLASGDAEGARAAAAVFGERFPNDSARLPDALALEAIALQDLGRLEDADVRLRELIARFPDSPAAQAAVADRPDLALPVGDDASPGDDDQ